MADFCSDFSALLLSEKGQKLYGEHSGKLVNTKVEKFCLKEILD
jgi:hypothetical protein